MCELGNLYVLAWGRVVSDVGKKRIGRKREDDRGEETGR